MIIYRIMTVTKRLLSLALAAFFIVSAVAAQEPGGNAPRQGAPRQLNLTAIKAVYGPDGLELRKKALENIREAAGSDNTGDDIYAALEYMSMEGLKNKTLSEKGHVLNNYPDIRLAAAVQLGKLGTEKAANILLQICNSETDLYVLYETIKALGDIGFNDNDKTVKTILWKVQGYNQRTPDNAVESVILSAIDAFEKIDKKNDGIKNQGVFKNVLEFLERVSKNESVSKWRGEGRISIQERAKLAREELTRREEERK